VRPSYFPRHEADRSDSTFGTLWCEFLREGDNHTVYVNRPARKSSSVPRHREVNDSSPVRFAPTFNSATVEEGLSWAWKVKIGIVIGSDRSARTTHSSLRPAAAKTWVVPRRPRQPDRRAHRLSRPSRAADRHSQRIRVAFRARTDRRIRAVNAAEYGLREFEWTPAPRAVAAGDWENYLRAAAEAMAANRAPGSGWTPPWCRTFLRGGAGLVFALMEAFTLALLQANHRRASFEELMEILPEGEQFVGTRGGGMDHAASLASREAALR